MKPRFRAIGFAGILWALFLIRGIFFCDLLPLWDGWDEYAHYGFVQYAANGGWLPKQGTPLSREIDESMRLVPLAHELGWIGSPYLTEDQWWSLPESERSASLHALAALPRQYQFEPASHPFTFYEAQQPPLYYWMVSFVPRLTRSWPLRDRVFLLRVVSLTIASLAIPLTFAAFPNRSGLRAAALLAIAPGFLIDTARVANDCLAIFLAAMLLYLFMKRKGWVAIGITLGAAILSKAYLLVVIPAALLRRSGWKSVALAVLLGAWWYARNLALGVGLTGWIDHTSLSAALAAAPQINWLAAAHVVAKSFIWFGAWSFLSMKSWIYLVFEAVGLIALVRVWPRRREMQTPLLMTAFFPIAIAYGVMNFYAIHHIGNIPGWYLWSVASPLAIIAAESLGSATDTLVSAFALLDLYGTAGLLAPYWAGLVGRNKASITAFPAALSRLHISPLLAILWASATLAIPVCCILLNQWFEPLRQSSSDT